MTRHEFQVEMDAARVALDEVLSGASPAALLSPRTIGAWSCADVLAHFAGYTRSIADQLASVRGQARGGPDYEAPEDATTDDYNEIVVEHWRKRQLEELLEEERAAFAALLREVLGLPEDALSNEAPFVFTDGQSLARILPNNSYAHYRMHLPELTAVLGVGGMAAKQDGQT
jgi:hypothetical protein